MTADHGTYCPRCDSEDCRCGGAADIEFPEPEVLGGSLNSHDSPNSQAETTEWPKMRPEAFHGVLGLIVRRLEPHTEADPAALLLTGLAMTGIAIGRGPHAMADGARHPARLNVVLVGKTSRGRKGTSFKNFERIAAIANPGIEERIMGGLASGEGLIATLGDSEEPGIPTDKRLIVHEPEFGRVLKVAARDGSTLSAVIREAWDGDRLRVMTRKDPLVATNTHVGIVAHVTAAELRRNLLETETANGFANRFLFGLTKRGHKLPFGGGLSDEDIASMAKVLNGAIDDATKIERVEWSEGARDEWEKIYRDIDDDADGLVGAITARAEAQMLRMGVTFAILDGSASIGLDHLKAAKAVWDYCEQSARYIFGDSLGDEVAQKLLDGLRAAGDEGLDGSNQHRLFNRHMTKARLEKARSLLLDLELITVREEQTNGRSRVIHSAKKAIQAKKAPPDPLNSHESLNSQGEGMS